ncbi:MAG: ATP-dependent RecD-like DNA helicase [Clostridia bacterium]|nr:ATP-dependent RecD-like DNA helicase [Clostridia bacterium]
MQIQGTVISKKFQAPDGYAVVEIAGDEPCIVVGVMPHIKTGEHTRFFGEFQHHAKYGRQFRADSYESTPPLDPDDMVLFLSSDFVKGIGPTLAQRLVDTFGQDTFTVIENEPERIASVPGISHKLAAELHDCFAEYAMAKYRYAELMALGLTAHQAESAEQALGGDAAAQIRENPYILIQHVRGIDFVLADRIAREMGVGHDSVLRMESAILHVLRKSLIQGNMFVERKRLTAHVADKLSVSEDQAAEALGALTLHGEVMQQTYGRYDVVMLRSVYELETESARRLIRILTARVEQAVPEADIERTARAFGLSAEQEQALKTVLSSSVSVITGGPGTGKTTILRALIRVLHAHGMSCRLGAPTGRAAKRMNEATGEDARTIHRLLEYAYDEEDEQGFFRVNEEEPLETDVVLIDETSMVDAFLFESLLEGIHPGTRLVLVGDADQLPSVGPGNVLRSLIASDVIPKVSLTYHFRNEGRIANAAHDILAGRMPQFDSQQFIMLEAYSPQEVQQLLVREYQRALTAGEDVQVLAPVKKNDLGSVELNALLRDAVNPEAPDKPQVVRGSLLFRQGDRVMQTNNDYQREWTNPMEGVNGTGVFNGDIGRIEGITGGELEVRFDDGRLAFYGPDELNQLDGAFAYTIHKSQGNEFDTVILPMLYPTGPKGFLSRSLLYTAVTRARRKVILIGAPATMRGMIENDARSSRASSLARELRFQAASAAPRSGGGVYEDPAF